MKILMIINDAPCPSERAPTLNRWSCNEAYPMCELFGMSSRLPTNMTFSLSILAERGGRLGPHKDGWGIAFNETNDFRIIKEAAPAANSACLFSRYDATASFTKTTTTTKSKSSAVKATVLHV